jgi:hypothetical protein
VGEEQLSFKRYLNSGTLNQVSFIKTSIYELDMP